jgi:GMP synthase-like glutamine amidotransferase
VSEIALSPLSKDLFKKKTLVRCIYEYVANTDEEQCLHQMHRDVVYDVPDGFVNLGSSSHVCNV